MQVIPVIDLMGGVVVRARMGERDSYRPIETPLSPTADPVDVVFGLRRLAPFPTLYIADLDAIRRRGENREALRLLHLKFPQMTFWIDNGASQIADVEAAELFGKSILGSESLRDTSLLSQRPDTLLSLDFRGDEFLGPLEVWNSPEIWPQKIIVMSLLRVGAGAGPDLERVKSVRERAGARLVYAAGGLRDSRDLVALKVSGVAGVLVASALHEGRLTPEFLI